MFITVVSTTNYNEKCTMDTWPKQTQSNPISKSRPTSSQAHPLRRSDSEASQTYADGQQENGGGFGYGNNKLKAIEVSCVVVISIVNLEVPGAEGIEAIEDIQTVCASWLKSACKRRRPVFNRNRRFIVKNGLEVIFAGKIFIVRIIHIQAESIADRALQKDLQIKYFSVRYADSHIDVTDGKMVWNFNDGIVHPASAIFTIRVIWAGDWQIEAAAVNPDGIGKNRRGESRHKDKNYKDIYSRVSSKHHKLAKTVVELELRLFRERTISF